MSEKKLKMYNNAIKKTNERNKILIVKEMFDLMLTYTFPIRLKIGMQIILGKKIMNRIKEIKKSFKKILKKEKPEDDKNTKQ